MRVLLQRVTAASVHVDGERIASIGPGLLALVGVGRGDARGDADRLAAKTVRLRLFGDGERPFHRALLDTGGELLAVSQFTLLGDARRGNRPSWSHAAPPDVAAPLVDRYAAEVAAAGVPVSRGRFGANMTVVLENDGPVTLLLDSEGLGGRRRSDGADHAA